MTTSLVSLDRGSRKLNYMAFSNNKLSTELQQAQETDGQK